MFIFIKLVNFFTRSVNNNNNNNNNRISIIKQEFFDRETNSHNKLYNRKALNMMSFRDLSPERQRQPMPLLNTIERRGEKKAEKNGERKHLLTRLSHIPFAISCVTGTGRVPLATGSWGHPVSAQTRLHF